MPLQNRVDPFAELFAASARGTLMGNRGGKFHTDRQKLMSRRWVSRQWICCALEFNNRRRDIWGRYYTELFFLDEVTAFAAGHRPCFECRRKDAEHFAALFSGRKNRARATAMDKILHAERLDGKVKRLHRAKIDALPDGAMIAINNEAFAICGKRLRRWTSSGYRRGPVRPHGIAVDLLTPPAIVAVLAAGYQPTWHKSV